MRYFGIIMTWLLMIIPPVAFLPSQCRAETDAEIQHLKDFIGSSECVFIRNNVEYDSAEALKHIMRKYDATQRWIHTTEDFIRLTATKSSISGKPYKVRCGDSEILCADWLYNELHRFREGSERFSDTVVPEMGKK